MSVGVDAARRTDACARVAPLAMDRARVFSAFDPARIAHEDDDVIVVDKPAGVASQAAVAERPDDLATRLRTWLSQRDRRDAYLGTHQRLDQETSGLVLFTKRPEANASIARQFESRAVAKTYVAGVTGRVRDGVLDDVLVRGEGGAMTVAGGGRGGRGPKTPAGQRAVTRVRVRARREDRALVTLALETGRTHQARVQLAHAGAPIAGDPLYGGAPAPRLLLHASELAFDPPRGGPRIVVRAPLPRIFDAWLEGGDPGERVYDDPGLLADALARARERRWWLGACAHEAEASRRTTTFRLVNEDGDGLPGLAVDVYDGWLVAQLYLGGIWESEPRRARVLDALHGLGFDGVYLKLRPKQANVLVDTRRDDVAPAHAVRGEGAPDPLAVVEEGTPFDVRLGDGLSTGLFLDQRDNRRLVREVAKGKRLLNLFAYTCGFSVAGALGGARATVSVDASLAALERGRAAFKKLGLLEGEGRARHQFVGEDVFAWLARAARKNELFDLVVLDPPSYSSTKKRRFSAESDYGDLVAQVAAVLAPGATLVASCNHRRLSRSKLRRMIGQGLRDAGRQALQIKDLAEGVDFPVQPAGGRDEPFMKSFLVRV